MFRTSKMLILFGVHLVSAKTKEGDEEIDHASERMTVIAGDKAAEFGKWVGPKSREGAEINVHFVDRSVKKAVHGIEHFGDCLK